MKIYTRGGDAGETGLLGGVRVAKDSLRTETCGQVDELNCLLGLARCEDLPAALDALLARVQHELFAVGAEVAAPEPLARGTHRIGPAEIAAVEAEIDGAEAMLSPLSRFILPGGSRAAATLHLARAVCRRAERRLVTLARKSDTPLSLDLIAYLNRLGDLLFVLARAANQAAGRRDVLWEK